MGGFGSGRNRGKYGYTVEDCLIISMNFMCSRKWIKPGKWSSGTLRWTRNEKETGSIGFESRMDIDTPYMRIHYTWKKTENRD